ncbi:zinc finger MYM-type protein 1-like [Schistocerca piceifrons]|uniref:zinc finger MYM-type protein 1-like n=1 Tax=Schistocerca piceifrons TaxID=274613 RepID=UPI001F5FC851|nr:zinc finger MYM-type protein 1-like [Schistocerca piceifrons]
MAGNYYRLHSNDFGHARSPKRIRETEELDRVFRGTVEAHHQKLLNTESEHWKNILEHLIAVIHFLGQHCLPLRGSTDTLIQPDNRNFLKLVELLGKFDTVMMEHLHRTKQGENKGHHYLGKESNNSSY